MRTITWKVTREAVTIDIAISLIHSSKWFTFEPLPDDVYEFTVKEELSTFVESHKEQQ